MRLKKKRQSAELNRVGVWLAVVTVAIVICVIWLTRIEFTTARPSSRPPFRATVISVVGHETQTGSWPSVVVKLPTGESVSVGGLSAGEFKKGSVVLVQEFRSRILGLRTYRAVGPVVAPPGSPGV